jgi:hypothetical protein
MGHWTDDPDDRTVVDAPDLTEHAHEFEDNDTPVTTHACARCGRVCVEAGRWDMLGGLPDFCVHSADGRWKYCAGTGPERPERVVYYPSGPPVRRYPDER